MKLLIVFTYCISCILGMELAEGDTCTTPCNATGICVKPKNCDYALKLLRKPDTTYEDAEYIQKSKCGQIPGRPSIPLTCCPELINPTLCGTPEVKNRIIGGTVTPQGEHPWAGLLIFDLGQGRFLPKCGATLISSQYVLTAAHCIMDKPERWILHRVRFTEFDALSKTPCKVIDDEEVCRQDLEVEDVLVHPQYNISVANKRHDIAIIKLKTKVTFTKYVKPICLPVEDFVRDLPIDDDYFTVTGWGQTEEYYRSGVQLHVDLLGRNNSVCDEAYVKANITLEDTHVCIGGKAGKDSCKGDSGGPLMRQVLGLWYQVGVVSFGAKRCGSEGLPGIYTNVAKYTDWLREIVYEGHCPKKT